MVRKKLASAILAISVMQAGWVSALGLGEANLKSSLNQPLVAEIQINDLGDLTPDQLVIKMASAEDFNRAGVERSFFVSSIKFDVRMDGRGTGIVRLVTREPVNEPYLNFVVEARWPTGRMLREYTLLLDLPVFSQGGTRAIDSATTSAVGAAVALADQSADTVSASRARSVSRASAARPAPSRSTSQPAGDGQHRVQSDETLWRIASTYRPAGATVQQTMVAIHRMNPNAFAHGDMNLVKEGAVLRLPTAADIEVVGSQAASSEVAQNLKTVKHGPDLDGRDVKESDASAPVSESRLSIATPSDASSAAGGGSAQALRDQLSASQENLDRVQREKAELESRVEDMERQMSTLQKILELKENQLNALQSQSEQLAGSSAEAKEESVAQNVAPAQEQVAADATVPAVKKESKPAPAPKAAKSAKPLAPVPVAQPSFVDQIKENIAAILGVVAVGAGAIYALMRRRNKAAAEEREVESLLASEDFLADKVDVDGVNILATAEPMAEANFDDTPVQLESEAITEPEAPQTTAQTGDPLAEADIYIAYGRYSQAVELLQNALRQEPARSDLHVKLLEVYLETKDKSGFQEQFSQLQQLDDFAAVSRVKELMSAFDGVEGWLETKESTSYVADVQPESVADDSSTLVDDEFKSDVATSEFNDEVALEFDTRVSNSEEELSLDVDDLKSDSELSLDADLNELSFDEFSNNLSSEDEQLLSEFSLDDEFLKNDASEALSEVNDTEFLVDTELASVEDSELADDLEKTWLGDTASNDTVSLETELDPIKDLSSDDFDLALNELDSSVDLTSLDSEFEELLKGADNLDLSVTDLNDSVDLASNADVNADFESLETPFDESTTEQNDVEVALSEFETLPELSEELGVELAAADEAVSESKADEFVFDPDLDLSQFDTPDSHTDLSFVDMDFESSSETNGSLESDEFDLSDLDEVGTKLDLARAYIDMGDNDGAKEILDEVLADGNDEQKDQASELLTKIV